jgi:hypothetical protein
MRKTPAILASLLALAAMPTPAADPALRIEGATGRDGVLKPALTLTMADLAAMPQTSARVKGRDGKERVYEGVLLADLLTKAGQPLGEDLRGSLLSRCLMVTAHDGYRVLFSLPEADPAFTEARIIVANRVDGQPLPEREGPLRFVVPSEKREARWIRMVEKIEILRTPEPIR